jgi:flagellin-like hook-associated protein FlgL
MPIVLNTNSAATEATFNLSRANDNLRRSISRLSSGNRITKPTDDAGGLAVAYKLQSSVKRTEASLNNHQNALSFLQVQDGVLEAMGDIVDRMAELRTMAADVSKNAADVENYSKEFLELQDQLAQMKREKFNGVELFAVENEQDAMKGINKSHLIVNGELHDNVNGKTYANKAEYEYFDDPLVENRTKSSFDKYEFQLYTNPSGVEEDGNIKLNIVNLQFMLGLKDPGAFGVDDTQLPASEQLYDTDTAGGFDVLTEWDTSPFNTDGASGASAGEIAASGLDINGNGAIDDHEWENAPLYSPGFGTTIKVENTINLAGLNQVTLDPGDGSVHASNGTAAPENGPGLNYRAMLTDENGDGTEGDGYIKDITKISIEEFTNIIEKIADVRAENGAEQQRVNQSLKLQQTNLVNLEAAHGRIMDVDVALESTRLARHSVTVQASAAMVAQANQMTAVALTLLSN